MMCISFIKIMPSRIRKTGGERSAKLRERSVKQIDPEEVLAISFSSQMQACIAVDEKGTVLYPAMIWADHRAEAQAEELTRKIGFDRMYEINGHRVSPQLQY